jgi:uncharacterized protein with GYD domain
VAAAGHAEMLADFYGLKRPPAPPEAAVLAAYEAITGYKPTQPDTDSGASIYDVLHYWQTAGIGGQVAGEYVKFDPKDPAHWKAAIYLFGFAYIGVWLPRDVTYAADHGQHIPWIDTRDRFDPGGDNGHSVIVAGYSPNAATVVTWGTTLPTNWDWLGKYCDEAFAVILPDWEAGMGPITGLDRKQLQADLSALREGDIMDGPENQSSPQRSPKNRQDFAMLLTLTDQGRNHMAEAAESLDKLGQLMHENSVATAASFMTFGEYDAVVVGSAPEEHTVVAFIKLIHEQGYFSVQTLPGVGSDDVQDWKLSRHA